VQWVPYALSGGRRWEDEESRYVNHLIGIAERFAPAFRESVVDVFALTPPNIERHFGITGGSRRCRSRGRAGGGSVIGAAGHNAAMRVMRDMA
jgi:hypothetical protein